MVIIRVTKKFFFEAAHALWNYDGKCKNIHGHSYKLYVTVTGKPIENKNDPKLGMVIDFGDLKQIINELIIYRYDHAIILNKDSDYTQLKSNNQFFERNIIVNFQPTCENMVADFAEKIIPNLPKNVKLYSLKLYETENSYAEWFYEDNTLNPQVIV